MVNSNQRRWMADKIGDLANLAVAALVFGQEFKGSRFIIGFSILIIAYLYGKRLLKGEH